MGVTMSTKVHYGWVIQQQAAVISGMSFGPGWLRGKQSAGPVISGYAHNLIGKDIVFYGNGKHALGAIVQQMQSMSRVKVRCGIYPGMTIETFKESEFGGGMDQVQVTATEKDITRKPYYLYVFKREKSDHSFAALVTSFGSSATGFIPSGGVNSLLRGAIDAGATLYQQGKNMMPDKAELNKAMKSSHVFVVLTSRRMHSRTPIAQHSHTHTMPTLAQDIVKAVTKAAA
ncbi:MAG: hypothetical protein ACLFRZ_10560 [Rhodosalinus sp.]